MNNLNKISMRTTVIPDRIEQLHTFHGGIKLPAHRELTDDQPIQPALVPKQLVIPLQQHIGLAASCLVRRVNTSKKASALRQPPVPSASRCMRRVPARLQRLRSARYPIRPG